VDSAAVSVGALNIRCCTADCDRAEVAAFMAAVNHGISWQQYCALVEAAVWLELPLPAQLVEYYWDVGHVGQAVGRFCRGELTAP